MAGGTQPLRVLQVGAEIYPLVKTGGLGDVMAALPPALAARGIEVRLLLPGYPSILQQFESTAVVAYFGPAFGAATIVVRFGRIEGVTVPAYVIDAPFLFERGGGPYAAADGRDWPDNARRYGALGWVAAHLGCGDIDWRWRPQIVHGHDWHAGMAPAYLALHPAPPCQSVFTVHNLAFHGLFERDVLRDLMLPERLFSPDGVEFHGTGSFIKAGLRFAGRISTVSPTYAREIQTEEFGCGLEGLIAQRRGALRGILNGVDYAVWNPASDPQLATHYGPTTLTGKAAAKTALQNELGLEPRADQLTIGIVSRLTQQKGMDLLARSIAELSADGFQFAIIGSGDRDIERALTAAAVAQPRAVAVKIGYDEELAHRVIAGADVICVPSRFEPCGLTQMYGLRYGTLPLVRRVGGLADTVVDADTAALAEDRATGFVFDRADAPSLVATMRRALALFRSGSGWTQVVARAMNQDFSWNGSAAAYIDMYRELVPAE